jgi:predicted amidohydrolase YtcJ
MLIRRAQIDGRGPFDVSIADGVVTRIAPRIDAAPGETVIDARGGELIAGLHDHHIHLFATAAARRSLACGPPAVTSRAALRARLADATAVDGWIRGIGYDESVAGDLDRRTLDGLRADLPVRIQHRSGQAWFVNSRAIDELGLATCTHGGIERDARGDVSGRLYRCDELVRERLGNARPSLSELGRELASKGVTGLTDATAANDESTLAQFADAIENGELPQRLVMMGRLSLGAASSGRIVIGAVKIVLDDRQLPAIDTLERDIRAAHAQGRAVALHCVTRSELLLALAAVAAAGASAGDRIEHAGVCPPECTALLGGLALTVVTQPAFIRERGDRYVAEVEQADLPWLYPCRSLCDAGIAVGGSSDAPYGPADPWAAMRTAVDRRTANGVWLGERERVSPERALALFTTRGEDPGGPPRRIAPGEAADLCLLELPWARMRDRLDSSHVLAAIRNGRLIWSRSDTSPI